MRPSFLSEELPMSKSLKSAGSVAKNAKTIEAADGLWAALLQGGSLSALERVAATAVQVS